MKTVKCSQCKHEINAEDVICMYCGSPNLVKEAKEEEIEKDFENIKNERHANEEVVEEEITDEAKEEMDALIEPEVEETETKDETESEEEPVKEEKPKRTRKTTTKKKTTTTRKPRKTTKKKEEESDVEDDTELKVEIPLEEILDRQSKHIEEELNKEHHDFDDEDVELQEDMSLDEIMNDKPKKEEIEPEEEETSEETPTQEEIPQEPEEETPVEEEAEAESKEEDVKEEKEPEEEEKPSEDSEPEEKEDISEEKEETTEEPEPSEEPVDEKESEEKEETTEEEIPEEKKEVELKEEIPLEDIIGEPIEKKEVKEETKEEPKEDKPEIKEYKPDKIEDTSVIKLNNTMDIATIFDEASDLLMSYGNRDEVVRLIETKYDLDHAKALSYVDVATKMAKNKQEKEELQESGIIEKEEEPEVKEEPKEDVNPDSITSIMSKLENYHNYTKAAMKKSKDPEEVAKLIMNEFSELDHDSAIELISQVKKDFIYKMAIIIGAALSLLIIIILAIF